MCVVEGPRLGGRRRCAFLVCVCVESECPTQKVRERETIPNKHTCLMVLCQPQQQQHTEASLPCAGALNGSLLLLVRMLAIPIPLLLVMLLLLLLLFSSSSNGPSHPPWWENLVAHKQLILWAYHCCVCFHTLLPKNRICCGAPSFASLYSLHIEQRFFGW